jgi:hypothetical protein
MAQLLSPSASFEDAKPSCLSVQEGKAPQGDTLLSIPRLLLLSHDVMSRTVYLPVVLRNPTEEVITSFYSSLSTLQSLKESNSPPLHQIATDHVPFGVDNFTVCESTLNSMIDDLELRAEARATGAELPGETKVGWKPLASLRGKTQRGKRNFEELTEILAAQDRIVRRDLFEQLRYQVFQSLR